MSSVKSELFDMTIARPVSAPTQTAAIMVATVKGNSSVLFQACCGLPGRR